MGCVRLPIRTSRQSLSPAAQGMPSLKIGETTRADVTNRFGPMDAYFDNTHVGYYKLNNVTQRRLWLALGIIPVGTSTLNWTDTAFLRFDHGDRIQQVEVISRTHAISDDWNYY